MKAFAISPTYEHTKIDMFIFLPPRRVEFGRMRMRHAVEMTHDGSLPIIINQLNDL